MTGLIVLINGVPGTAKTAIAQHVAEAMDLRVVDNLALRAPAAAVLDRRDPHFQPLCTAIRELVLGHLARQEGPLRLVMTETLFAQIPADRIRMGEIGELARAQSARLATVLLSRNFEALRRAATTRGAQHMWTYFALLEERRGGLTMQRPPHGECFEVDVTRLEEEDAAQAIVGLLA